MLSLLSDRNVRLYSGDRILNISKLEDQTVVLRCGQIYIDKDDDWDFSDEEVEKVGIRGRVIWEGKQQKVAMNLSENYLVMDRRFSIGQRVKRHGYGGEILSVDEKTTLCIHGKDEIITTAVPVERLKPLSNAFYAVNVEFMGWIGMITEVHRRHEMQFDDGTKCYMKSTDPIPAKLKSRKHILVRSYPYIAGAHNLVAPGIKTTLSSKFLKKFVTWDPDTCKTEISQAAKKYAERSVQIVSTQIHKIAVDWLGTIGDHKNKEPKEHLREAEISQLTYFYIHPSRFLYKNGLCLYEIGENDQVEDRVDVDKSLACLVSGEVNLDEPCPPKRRKCDPEIEAGQKLIVHKHMIRHHYEVKWDHREEISWYEGCELELDESSLNSANFIPPICFVKKKTKVFQRGREYGVVTRRTPGGNLEVQWLRVFEGEVIIQGDVTEVSSLDILPYDKFNKIQIGKHVSLKKPSLCLNGFQFGTVMKIERHKHGKIIVYCCTEKIEKEMWPYELELINYDPHVWREPTESQLKRK